MNLYVELVGEPTEDSTKGYVETVKGTILGSSFGCFPLLFFDLTFTLAQAGGSAEWRNSWGRRGNSVAWRNRWGGRIVGEVYRRALCIEEG